MSFYISGYFRKYDTALGASIFIWLFLVIFSDLGIIGTSFLVNLDINQVFILTLLNPVQVFKLSAVFSLRDNLEILGPVGIYAVRNFGGSLQLLLTGIMLTSSVIFIWLTQTLFKKRGAV